MNKEFDFGEYDNGDVAIRKLTPLIRKFARRYTKNHYNVYDDLIQAGCEGVLIAASKFKRSKNVKFSTFAFFYIRKEMQKIITPNWKYDNATINQEFVPEGSYDFSFDEFAAMHEFNKLEEGDQKLIQMRSEGYTLSEIADELGCSIGKARSDIIKIQEQLAG